MQRTQIQLPEPLLTQIKAIAQARDWSVAELIRRGMEAYVQTCPDPKLAQEWVMPVLRSSGGQRIDPASVRLEADVMASRFSDEKRSDE